MSEVNPTKIEPTSTASEETLKGFNTELGVQDVIKLFLRHWQVFTALFVVLAAVSTIYYWLFVPYVGTSQIIINDHQNSSLQAFSANFFKLSKTTDTKKSNSSLAKNLEYFKTKEFLETYSQALTAKAQSKEITMDEKAGADIFSKKLTGDSGLSALNAMTSIKLDSDYSVKAQIFTNEPELSLFLTNTLGDVVLNKLKEKELGEIAKVENFIQKQKEETDKNIRGLSQELEQFQNKPENVIALTSKEKMGDYMSELMVRENEIKLKIAENNKLIEYLQGGATPRRKESALYGRGGKAEALKLENSMNYTKLSQLRVTIDRLTKEAKAVPMAAHLVDDLKRKSEFEYSKYKELSEEQSKAQALRLSIDSRYEVLQKLTLDNIAPRISWLTLMMISFILAQLLGSLYIYFKYLFDPNYVTASRNVVIIDSHNFDPRVIIENSKIRFKLKDKNFNEETPDQPNWLTWNPFKKD